MLQAMTNVHSYKMTMDTTSGGAYPSKQHMVAIYIRTGKTLSFDTTVETISPTGKTTTMEVVLEGSRMCMKGIVGTAWSCSTDAALAASLGNIGDLTKEAQNLETSGSYKDLGQKTVQGQVCDGYTFTSKAATSTSSGTAWINASTHLLAEEDSVTSMVISKGAKPTITTLKLVVSNYDDPSLKLPKV